MPPSSTGICEGGDGGRGGEVASMDAKFCSDANGSMDLASLSFAEAGSKYETNGVAGEGD